MLLSGCVAMYAVFLSLTETFQMQQAKDALLCICLHIISSLQKNWLICHLLVCFYFEKFL